MATPKKQKGAKPARVVLSNNTPWAIINKNTGLAVGTFHPEGNNAVIRRVAIAAAKEHGISYGDLWLTPVLKLSEEDFFAAKVPEAPRLVDPKIALKEAKKGPKVETEK